MAAQRPPVALTKQNMTPEVLNRLFLDIYGRLHGSGATAAVDGSTSAVISGGGGGGTQSGADMARAEITWGGGVPTIVNVTYADGSTKNFDFTWTGGVPVSIIETVSGTVYTLTWVGGVPTVIEVS